jgi:RNA methyltransferase, TrmH family
MKSIPNRQHPVVRAFRDLARAPDTSGTRLLLDGVHLVREAKPAAIETVVVASPHLIQSTEERSLAEALERNGVEVLSASDAIFASLSPVRTPSGIVAIATRQPTSAEAICRDPRAFVVAAVDVQDPGNLGSLIRSAEAGGATGVLVCGASATPFSWKALRGSMGSALRLPIVAGLSVDMALAYMKSVGMRTVCAIPHGGELPEKTDWSEPVALLLGGEGPGLDQRVAAQCDAAVTIPMARPVESLNVAVAGAILIYAARRVRA